MYSTRAMLRDFIELKSLNDAKIWIFDTLKDKSCLGLISLVTRMIFYLLFCQIFCKGGLNMSRCV